MKLPIIFTILLLILISVGVFTYQSNPRTENPSKQHVFLGTFLRSHSTHIEGVVKIRNTLKVPVNVIKLKTSCSCIIADSKLRRIDPGGTLEIAVKTPTPVTTSMSHIQLILTTDNKEFPEWQILASYQSIADISFESESINLKQPNPGSDHLLQSVDLRVFTPYGDGTGEIRPRIELPQECTTLSYEKLSATRADSGFLLTTYRLLLKIECQSLASEVNPLYVRASLANGQACGLTLIVEAVPKFKVSPSRLFFNPVSHSRLLEIEAQNGFEFQVQSADVRSEAQKETKSPFKISHSKCSPSTYKFEIICNPEELGTELFQGQLIILTEGVSAEKICVPVTAVPLRSTISSESDDDQVFDLLADCDSSRIDGLWFR